MSRSHIPDGEEATGDAMIDKRKQAHHIASIWASRFGNHRDGPPSPEWIQRAADLAYEALVRDEELGSDKKMEETP